MAITYALVNQKGGVGKTSTADALASGMKERGHSVLVVDVDPQANLSYAMDALSEDFHKTSWGILMKEVSVRSAIRQAARGDIVPATNALSGADGYLNAVGKEYRLREALDEVRNDYDFIVIDTPPALGILIVNALTAADRVVIPAQADIYSIQGIEQLTDTIRSVRQYCNPALQIDGILMTRYNGRTVLSREVMEQMRHRAKQLESRVYDSTIREGIAVKEAQVSRKSIFDYAPTKHVTDDYSRFVQEVLKAI